jgi:hypothetical protein
MPPELFFLFTLVIKMAVAGLFVISATIIAERAGPFIGALVLTLPVSAGPAYVFLSLDHDAAFISQSALASLSNNVSTFFYTLIFLFVAQRFGTAASVLISIAGWAAVSVALQVVPWTATTAVLANVAVFVACFYATRRYADAPMPRVPLRFSDVLLRAALVATIVALVVSLSFTIGAAATGLLAAFPVVYTSIFLILNRRVGTEATAAVIAHGYAGLLGFGMSAFVLHAAALPLGKPLALLAALVFALAWNLSLFAARRFVSA